VVFTLSLKYLSFKQDLSNIESMLDDQEATYAILRYALDVPTDVYRDAMYMLEEEISSLRYHKLISLVYNWIEYNDSFQV
jgi:hypothetical protein